MMTFTTSDLRAAVAVALGSLPTRKLLWGIIDGE